MNLLRPVVISGPSGCGKSTLLNILFKDYENAFGFSVSHTSRKPRSEEVNGVHYHFSTREEIQRQISEGLFIEHAEFSGNIYGTSKSAVQDVMNQNKICVLDLEEKGVRSIKNTDLDALFVFIKPPSMEELRNRLTKRGTERPESLEKRMDTAKSAIEFSEQPGVYDLIVVNDNLQYAYRTLRNYLEEQMPTLKGMQTENKINKAESSHCLVL